MSVASTALAGTIVGARTSRSGNIAGTRSGNIAGTRSGNIAGTRSGNIAGTATAVRPERLDLSGFNMDVILRLFMANPLF